MKKSLFALVVGLAVIGVYSPVYATHSWGGYHWARTTNPFTIKLGDNLSGSWDPFLVSVSNDWSVSSVLDTVVVTGQSNPKTCKPTMGRVEVCNAKYGSTQWLGIASIWANGTHITQGTVKLNDTYFSTSKYNTPAWKNLVACQEIGHTFGLDHQDENFNNLPLGTCMDYTSDPTPNQHPNAHDYEMLETIYAHLDPSTTVGQSTAQMAQEVDHSDAATWGKMIHTTSDKRGALFERDFGNGQKVFTFVVWAE